MNIIIDQVKKSAAGPEAWEPEAAQGISAAAAGPRAGGCAWGWARVLVRILVRILVMNARVLVMSARVLVKGIKKKHTGLMVCFFFQIETRQKLV